MNWILIAYLVVLVFLSTRQAALPRDASLRTAWKWFAVIPLSEFFFTLVRAGNSRDSQDLLLVEIWATGFAWLLLGISLFCLRGIFPRPREPDEGGATDSE